MRTLQQLIDRARRELPSGKPRILILADFLDELPRWDFNLADWGEDIILDREPSPHCGSPACIAGWALRLFHSGPATNIPKTAARSLSLREVPHGLFTNWRERGLCVPVHSVTPSQAATVLRRFYHTGEVDWSIITPSS